MSEDRGSAIDLCLAALADAKRRDLLRILSGKPMSIEELHSAMGVGPHQLRNLITPLLIADLIVEVADGRYQADAVVLQELVTWVQMLAADATR